MDTLLSLSIGIALSMDCLAVASCYGLQTALGRRFMIELGIYFGVFQAVMIFTGGLMGSLLVSLLYKYAKWISVILLVIISIKMFIDGIKKEDSCYGSDRITMLSLAFATSIDSLLVGLAFSAINAKMLFTAFIVGIVCFVITISGFIIGRVLHRLIGSFAEFVGAIILLIIAIKTAISIY